MKTCSGRVKWTLKGCFVFCAALVLLGIVCCVPSQTWAQAKGQVVVSLADPQYPEAAEYFGLNVYFAALSGLMEQHPALRGKMTLKIMDKGTLYANQAEAVTALANGAIQMSYAGTAMLEQLSPEFRLGMTPGVFRNWDHFLKAMETPVWKELQEKIAREKGVTILKWAFHCGDWFLFTNKGPMKTAADLKGMKIRYPGGAAFGKALSALKITGVALPYTEVVTALQTKLVSGVMTDFTGGVPAFDLPRYTSYALRFPDTLQPICIIVNTKWWKSLDDKQREALLIPFDRADIQVFFNRLEKEAIQKWIKNPKLKVNELSKEELARWRTVIRGSVSEVLAGIDPKYIKAIDSIK